MSELEDHLQHHGVKGMKWGVRKAVQKAGRSLGRKLNENRAKRLAKADSYHEKRKKSKIYKNDYNYYKKQARGTDKQKHYAAIDRVRKDRANLALSTAMLATGSAMTAYAKVGRPIVSSAIKKATSPEAIRAGKNIMRAIKRNPTRIVDGKTMKNVVDMVNAVAVRR